MFPMPLLLTVPLSRLHGQMLSHTVEPWQMPLLGLGTDKIYVVDSSAGLGYSFEPERCIEEEKIDGINWE